MRARVPGVLYLNFLADYEYAARLAPESFRPDLMTTHAGKTLFTILLFQLREGRPVRAPALLGRFAPDLWQSNWRFYGTLTSLPEGARPGVLFWLTVTDSRCLNLFGRRIGRCFPVRRAHRIEVRREGDEVRAFVDPGNGTAPHLSFRGRLTRTGDVPSPLVASFGSFARGLDPNAAGVRRDAGNAGDRTFPR